jgi:hypothetical protein
VALPERGAVFSDRDSVAGFDLFHPGADCDQIGFAGIAMGVLWRDDVAFVYEFDLADEERSA